jgi:hypothetical protein
MARIVAGHAVHDPSIAKRLLALGSIAASWKPV